MEGLDIGFMDQTKFVAAALLLEPPGSPKTPTAAKKLWEVESPKGSRKNTKEYWQLKFGALQNRMKNIVETPVTPEEIEGLTKIQKFKPQKSKSMRITQVQGSLTGKDILQKKQDLQVIEDKKNEEKEQKQRMKVEQKERFIRCRNECTCKQFPCFASNLRQCPICSDVMKSQCSKAKCKLASGTDKPVMVLVAAKSNRSYHKAKPAKKKQKVDDIYSDLETESLSSIEYDSEDSTSPSLNPNSNQGPHKKTMKMIYQKDQLNQLWNELNLPTPESDIVGKWYAACWKSTKTKKEGVFIGKVKKRFLDEAEGRAISLELDFLKPRVGSGTTLDEYPPGTWDLTICPITDVIGGPLEVRYVGKGKWDIIHLDQVETFFNKVKNLDRSCYYSTVSSLSF